MKRNENMPITGIAEKLGYSAADMSALAANGVIKSVPNHSGLYNLPDVRAAIKAYENGEEPPPPRAKKAAKRKSAKKAEPEMPITPVPSMPPPKPEEYDELKDAPTIDTPVSHDDVPAEITPKDTAREKYLKARADRMNAELNLAIKKGEFVSKREAEKTGQNLRNAVERVIDGMPDLYAPRLMKAGVKSRGEAVATLNEVKEWVQEEVLAQFKRADKQISQAK